MQVNPNKNASFEDLITSPFSRFLKIGSMVGKIGFSLIGEKTLNLFYNETEKFRRNSEFWFRNGNRIFFLGIYISLFP